MQGPLACANKQRKVADLSEKEITQCKELAAVCCPTKYWKHSNDSIYPVRQALTLSGYQSVHLPSSHSRVLCILKVGGHENGAASAS